MLKCGPTAWVTETCKDGMHIECKWSGHEYAAPRSTKPPGDQVEQQSRVRWVWAGRTLGKMPPKNICRVGSCRRWLRDSRPRFSDRSWNRILMKMRLLEVVSSSVRRMQASTDQLRASVVSRCCTASTQLDEGPKWGERHRRLSAYIC